MLPGKEPPGTAKQRICSKKGTRGGSEVTFRPRSGYALAIAPALLAVPAFADDLHNVWDLLHLWDNN